MPNPLAIAIGISAGATLLGGIISSRTSAQNAEAQQAAAQQNANAQLIAGQQSAALQRQISLYNAQIALKQGEFTAGAIEGIADYNISLLEQARDWNIGLTRAATDYNSLLLDSQLQSTYEAYELDSFLLERDLRRVQGSQIAKQGASGTVIGEGSNLDILVDNATSAALDQLILKYNADLAAADILNARARNEWEGSIAIRNLIFNSQQQMNKISVESMWNAASARISGQVAAAAERLQGALAAGNTLINTRNQAQSIINYGNAAYQSGMNQASGQLWGSVIGAIGAGASTYAGYKAQQASVQSALQSNT